MAHITAEVLTEIFQGSFQRYRRCYKRGSWPVHPVFELIRKAGNVPDKDMKKTFNMGIVTSLLLMRKRKEDH